MAKKLRLRNIFGKLTTVDLGGGSEETSQLKYASTNAFIADLEERESSDVENPYEYYNGKIIYIEEDNGYYIFDATQYESDSIGLIPITPTPVEVPMPLVDYTTKTNDTKAGGFITENAIAIDPNKYYLFGSRTDLSIYVTRYMEPDVCFSYTGRFTVDADISSDFTFTIFISKSNSIPDEYHGITITDNSAELGAGRTYEFNILYDSCTITDITHTDN